MNSKSSLEYSIARTFGNNVMPDGYINDVQYWGNIPRNEIYKKLPDGTPAMQMMDIDFGNKCSLRCPHCFRRDPRNDVLKNPLSNEEIIDYIKQGKELGLKSVKILGRGEPFQNPDFLDFLCTMTDMDIGVGIFTKGTVLGSDNMAATYNKKHGIKTAKELVDAVKELKTAIYLNFMSFDENISTRMVGNIPEYVQKRNNALSNLVDAGFNDFIPGTPTRLALICAPYTPETINEVYGIYKFAHERNMYMVACPTTVSGKGLDEFKRQQETVDYKKYLQKTIDVYSDIYAYAITQNIINMDDFELDGPHIYPGAHPCNQTRSGFYLQLSGQVVWCPGRVDDETKITTNIREYPTLKDCWLKSPACKIAAKYDIGDLPFNCGCVARDTKSVPLCFYSHVKNMTMKKLQNAGRSY